MRHTCKALVVRHQHRFHVPHGAEFGRHCIRIDDCAAFTLLGSGPIVLLSLPAGLAVSWSDIGWPIWAGMFYAVIISAFLGWLAWGWINGARGVARTAPLMYLMPPVAGLVAWALTGEHYSAIKVGGAALTLAGVALAQFGSSPRDPVREAPAPVD